MSRSVKRLPFTTTKVREQYMRYQRRRSSRKKSETLISEKDFKKLHPIELYQTPKDIYISLMERLSRAYN